jgi:hypothetical protein
MRSGGKVGAGQYALPAPAFGRACRECEITGVGVDDDSRGLCFCRGLSAFALCGERLAFELGGRVG